MTCTFLFTMLTWSRNRYTLGSMTSLTCYTGMLHSNPPSMACSVPFTMLACSLKRYMIGSIMSLTYYTGMLHSNPPSMTCTVTFTLLAWSLARNIIGSMTSLTCYIGILHSNLTINDLYFSIHHAYMVTQQIHAWINDFFNLLHRYVTQ